LWTDNIRKSPKQARAYINLGASLDGAGRMDEAIAQFEKAVELGPDEKRVLAYSNLGMIYARKGEYRKGLQFMELATKMAPSYTRHFFFQGLAYHKTNQFELAEQFYKKASQESIYQGIAKHNLAMLYLKKGEDATAEHLLLEVIEMHPKLAVSYYVLGKIYISQKKFQKAETYLSQASSLGHSEEKAKSQRVSPREPAGPESTSHNESSF